MRAVAHHKRGFEMPYAYRNPWAQVVKSIIRRFRTRSHVHVEQATL